jgi:hypothetical protein
MDKHKGIHYLIIPLHQLLALSMEDVNAFKNVPRMEDVNAFKNMPQIMQPSALVVPQTSARSSLNALEQISSEDSEGPECGPESRMEGASEQESGSYLGVQWLANGGGLAGAGEVKSTNSCVRDPAGIRSYGARMGQAERKCFQRRLEQMRDVQRQEVKAARVRHHTVTRRLESLKVDPNFHVLQPLFLILILNILFCIISVLVLDYVRLAALH